jgi:hypothetical protein
MKYDNIIWISNLSIISVPDEGSTRNVPDEGSTRNVPDEGYTRIVPDEGYTSSGTFLV